MCLLYMKSHIDAGCYSTGRRRVCIPPRVGWMCERRATLIKRDIILEREQLERQRIRQVLQLLCIHLHTVYMH
jgi:hypothetical protein